YLQDFLQTSGSAMMLPAVNWRAIRHLIEQTEKNDKWNVVSINGMELPDVKTPSSKNTLFLVTLPPVNRINDKSALKTLTENDKIIRNVISALNNKGISYSAIYTAERPSATYQRMDAAVQTGRRLMATTTVSYPPLNVTNGTGTCIIFYATNFTITANKTNMIDLTALTFTAGNVNTSASECTSTNTTLSLKYQNPLTGFNGIEIRFNMQNNFYTGSARNWFTLDTMEIIQDNGQTAVFNVSIVSAPAEYSFHCQEVGTSSRYGAVLTPVNSVAQQWSVYIYEFQIQGFNVNGGLFSYASDCTSFFTAPIWMAIVTCLVLLYIVTYGLHMIMQLTTNERFDDPKGQTLSVPQTE
ncbi:V-type proton ATPase subunit S1-like, partial [Protopterus annectens]|uniref:V-type proton ATPase subunit S1-like n=1 Tax=Protopterus annectens TaxID=7888 RepID=UPI001CFB5C36